MQKVNTLNDAIRRSKEIIEILEKDGDTADGERQLLEWLMELKKFKESEE